MSDEITFELALNKVSNGAMTVIDNCIPAVNNVTEWLRALGVPQGQMHYALAFVSAACLLEAGRIQEFNDAGEQHREDDATTREPVPMKEARRVVGIVACCGQKAGLPMAARELYQSHLFRLSKRYVMSHCQEWIILSARYGVVMPDEVIAPYDVSLPTRAAERKEWAQTCNKDLRDRFPDAYFVVLAGERYRDALQGLSHDVPMQGLGIGKQIQWLRQQWEEPEIDITETPG